MDLIETVEGRTRFFVPVQDEESDFPPASGAVFYNRRMEINRDATVLLLKILSPGDYVDVMGASGARGLRVAHECSIPVTINDRDEDAIRLIEKNVAHSGLETVTVRRCDANVLLSGCRFDAVDLDPFGSPAPFLDSAIRSTKRYLMLTATDTAPLCGAHKKAGIRRYYSSPSNTEYHSEVGLRTLLAFAVRETVKYDIGIEPLFCFSREHFLRLHLRFIRGAAAADRTLRSIGFIHQCPGCPTRYEQQGMFPEHLTCGYCDSPLVPVGPLWLGRIQKDEVLETMKDLLPEAGLGSSRELSILLDTLREELPTSTFFDYHQLAKTRRLSPPPMQEYLGRLKEKGYDASRCHYLGTGIKTTAPLDILFESLTP
jgi:tRNA (guanine26-N2/guanine27-N2)-dimethyltransferase